MKKICVLILSLCVVLALGMTVSAAAETGTCGNNLTWTLDNGVLTISGTGEMSTFPDFGDNHSTIHTVIIEEGVTTIGNGAFWNGFGGNDYSGLKTVQLPDSLTKIGMMAFHGTGIEEIVIPDHVNEIGHEAFNDCLNLKKVTLGASISGPAFKVSGSIPGHRGERPFENCPNLTEIALSPRCSSLVNYQGYIMNPDKTYVLFAPEGLTGAVVLPDTCYTMNDYAFAKSKITSVTFPAGYRFVEDSSFRDCDNLTEVIIPEGVTDVDARAFQNCDKLKKVYLPSTLTWLGMYVFTDCPLESVSYGGSEEDWAALEKQFELDTAIMTFNAASPDGSVKPVIPDSETPDPTDPAETPDIADLIVAGGTTSGGILEEAILGCRKAVMVFQYRTGNMNGIVVS